MRSFLSLAYFATLGEHQSHVAYQPTGADAQARQLSYLVSPLGTLDASTFTKPRDPDNRLVHYQVGFARIAPPSPCSRLAGLSATEVRHLLRRVGCKPAFSRPPPGGHLSRGQSPLVCGAHLSSPIPSQAPPSRPLSVAWPPGSLAGPHPRGPRRSLRILCVFRGNPLCQCTSDLRLRW